MRPIECSIVQRNRLVVCDRAALCFPGQDGVLQILLASDGVRRMIIHNIWIRLRPEVSGLGAVLRGQGGGCQSGGHGRFRGFGCFSGATSVALLTTV